MEGWGGALGGAFLKRFKNFDLTGFSSLGVKAFCKEAIFPENLEDLKEVVQESPRILGGGTNVLFGRSFLDFKVVIMKGAFKDMEFQGNRAFFGAGLPLSRAVEEAAKRGLSGLEGLFGIPGTVGGAVCGNAGTRLGSIGDVVRRVFLVSWDGKELCLQNSQFEFGYRYSSVKGLGVVFAVEVELERCRRDVIEKRMDEALKARKGQPKGVKTLGCTFKNLPDIPAGMLLEKLGLKGFRVGGASFSEVHANFMVNQGGRPEDFLELIKIAKEKAREAGFNLEEEIEVWV